MNNQDELYKNFNKMGNNNFKQLDVFQENIMINQMILEFKTQLNNG